MLKKDDPDRQLVYYQVRLISEYSQSSILTAAQAGIGTYTTPQIATPMASKISKVKYYN